MSLLGEGGFEEEAPEEEETGCTKKSPSNSPEKHRKIQHPVEASNEVPQERERQVPFHHSTGPF